MAELSFKIATADDPIYQNSGVTMTLIKKSNTAKAKDEETICRQEEEKKKKPIHNQKLNDELLMKELR